MSTDQEKHNRYRKMDSKELFEKAQSKYDASYHLLRDVHIIKNILLLRGEDVSDLRPYDPYSPRD